MLGTYHRLGVDIYASDITVIRAIRRKITRKARKARSQRKARHALYRAVLQCHHEARALARHFAL